MDKKSEIRMIHDLLKLAIAVQQHTEYCVFIQMSGHVHQIEIDIRESKAKYQEQVASSSFTIEQSRVQTKDDYNKYFLKRYNEIKNVLVGILRDGEIDNDLLREYERIEYDYKF